MVVVAQLVRAPGCGPGGRGFESPHPPHLFSLKNATIFHFLIDQLKLANKSLFLLKRGLFPKDGGKGDILNCIILLLVIYNFQNF